MERGVGTPDNEAARLGLVKAYSPVLPSLNIIMACLKWDFEDQFDSWYAGIPSASNPSDGPSRLQFEWAATVAAAVRVDPILQ